MKIEINRKYYEVPATVAAVSYENVLIMAGKDPKLVLTVTYDPGNKVDRRGGTIAPGQSVTLCEGMIFTIADTSRA